MKLLLVLGLKKCLVECATVGVKSAVILNIYFILGLHIHLFENKFLRDINNMLDVLMKFDVKMNCLAEPSKSSKTKSTWMTMMRMRRRRRSS